MSLQDLMARAGKLAPMHSDTVPILQGRTLYVDGDGLAYACAGNDETLVSQARARVREKLDGWQRACGADKVVILLTGSGGHKGHRYAIARVKPYQGKRTNSRRPKNWQPLRDLLEQGHFGTTIVDYDREADDRFGQYGWADPENTVIATQDKDMQMVPGYHINWADSRVFYLPPDTFDMTHNAKQFGLKWFWLQMLHGDNVDWIPGLPQVSINGGKLKLCGDVTAQGILRSATNNQEAALLVASAYRTLYRDRWLVEMAEQACLLWMRPSPNADWFDALNPEGPLGMFELTHRDLFAAASQEIAERVHQAKELNDLAAQSL